MPLREYAEWVNAPGTRVDFRKGRAGILILHAYKEFSPRYTLDLEIIKTTLYEGCKISSKLLPLVMAMREKRGDMKLYDFYSFDNNGICLSHGYSRYKGGKTIIDEQHDADISRLVENGATISEMMRDYPDMPFALTIHPTMGDVRYNSWGK